MESNIDLELNGLSDQEVLELYELVEEHLKYLDSSVLVVEDEVEESEGTEDGTVK